MIQLFPQFRPNFNIRFTQPGHLCQIIFLPRPFRPNHNFSLWHLSKTTKVENKLEMNKMCYFEIFIALWNLKVWKSIYSNIFFTREIFTWPFRPNFFNLGQAWMASVVESPPDYICIIIICLITSKLSKWPLCLWIMFIDAI